MFQSWEVQNEAAVDQPKTAMKVEVDRGETANDCVAAMETATEAEGAETSMAETSLSITVAVMMAETVAAAAAAVVFAAVHVGRSFFHQTRWRFHRARRTSPLKCPSLWNVAALPKASYSSGAA